VVPDSPKNPSPQIILQFIHSRAPEGVLATIKWLQDNGWNAISGKGGADEPFGNALLVFRHAADEVRILRDRLEWSLQIRLSGWSRWFDLSFIVDTKTGRTRWDRLSQEISKSDESLDGSTWMHVLPDVLEWTASMNDVEAKIEEMLAERYRQLFPDWNKKE
jgi:hypothetical protein